MADNDAQKASANGSCIGLSFVKILLGWQYWPGAPIRCYDGRSSRVYTVYIHGSMGYAELENLPSGKRLHNYGKSQFSMGKSTISTAIFNSYVKLPEGTKHPKLLNHRSESLPNYRNTPRLQVGVKWLGVNMGVIGVPSWTPKWPMARHFQGAQSIVLGDFDSLIHTHRTSYIDQYTGIM